MKILLIEDNRSVASSVRSLLKMNYLVDIAFTGEEGKEEALTNIYDLIICDVLLTDMSGIDVCRFLRKSGLRTPILMLTAQKETSRKVSALDAGADDYLTKPFSLDELQARIRALLRRGPETMISNLLSAGDLTLDLNKRIVIRRGKIIKLRRKELNLLEYLLRNKGRVMSRSMILDHLWDKDTNSSTNTVDVHIKYLRDLIDKPFEKKLIKTIHGIGYRIEE